jgi:DNA-binding phage protein
MANDTARVSDDTLKEMLEGAEQKYCFDDPLISVLRELVARRQQMSGIAQRSAEKIYRSMNFDTTAGMINEWPSEEEIAAIIEHESERNGKQ